MKWINVSMTPSRLAFANRLLAQQIKATAPGRVNAPDTHPRLIAGLIPWIFQTSIPSLRMWQGLLRLSKGVAVTEVAKKGGLSPIITKQQAQIAGLAKRVEELEKQIEKT